MTKSILFEIDAQIALLKQAKALLSSAGTTAIKRKLVQDSSHRRSGCPEGEEAQENECRGSRTRPSSADQALGRTEGRFQGKHERHYCFVAKGKEEGGLICFSAEYNRFRNDTEFCRQAIS